jgi:DNA-directed RNA polymerase subunit omega
MARITVEDCIEKVPNRFHLVQMAAIRAKQLKKGATPFVVSDENKEVVTALREIAAGYVKPDYPEEETEAVEAAPATVPNP